MSGLFGLGSSTGAGGFGLGGGLIGGGFGSFGGGCTGGRSFGSESSESLVSILFSNAG